MSRCDILRFELRAGGTPPSPCTLPSTAIDLPLSTAPLKHAMIYAEQPLESVPFDEKLAEPRPPNCTISYHHRSKAPMVAYFLRVCSVLAACTV